MASPSSLGLGLLVVACVVQAPRAAAQLSGDEPAPSASYQRAFQRMSQDLNDPDAIFAFAAVAASEGDFAAAIAALERLLRQSPDLDNIRLELGLLYLRVGQPELAKAYLEEARNSPRIPRFARDRAEIALAHASGQAARHSGKLKAFATVGYESNPNASPTSALVFDPFLGRTTEIAGDQLSLRADGDVVVAAGAEGEYRFDLDMQQPAELVVDGNLYASLYGETEGLNMISAFGRVGPRIFSTGYDSAIRPYVSAGVLTLDGDTYFSAAGAGASWDWRAGPDLDVGAVLQMERRTFSDTAARPRADDQTGDYLGAGVHLASVRVDGAIYRAQLSYDRGDTKAVWQDHDRYDVAASLEQPFGPVRLTGAVGYRHTNYMKPDPMISPNERRIEDRYSIGVICEFPLFDGPRLQLQAEQVWNNSSLPNYRYENTVARVWVGWTG